MLKADTIEVDNSSFTTDSITVKKKELTVEQVLSWLPSNATPAQQDSMVQTYFKPAPITWSNRPDTLRLPGQKLGRSALDVELPQYYKESFFSNSKMYHPELRAGRQGIAGDPISYSIAGDDLITSILIFCFLFGCIAFAKSKQFILLHIKYFFHPQLGSSSIVNETTREIRFQLFLTLQTSLLFSLAYLFYIKSHQGDTFIIEQYKVIGIGTLILLGYFAFKFILYSIVNWTFFNRRQRDEWMRTLLFIISTEGILLMPCVLLQAYFELSLDNATIYIATIIILFKLFTLYKQTLIFSKGIGVFMQIFLYFCTLEIVPLLALVSTLTAVAGYLKINY